MAGTGFGEQKMAGRVVKWRRLTSAAGGAGVTELGWRCRMMHRVLRMEVGAAMAVTLNMDVYSLAGNLFWVNHLVSSSHVRPHTR